MTSIKRRYFALAGSLAMAGGLALAVAPAAHATTADCQAAHGNACATFSGKDSVGNTVYWDDKGQVRAPNAVIIGYSANSSGDPATDFTKVQHKGHVAGGPTLSDQFTKSYSFVYTPRGSWSNLCIADPNDGRGLVLRTCNGGPYQRFFADRNPDTAQQIGGDGSDWNGDSIITDFQGDYALQNAASRQFVTDHAPVGTGDTRQLVTDTVTVSAAFTPNQIWTWMP